MEKQLETPGAAFIENAVAEIAGAELCGVWKALRGRIEQSYDMQTLWGSGGKRWTYEFKYRRGGKTLCALYAKPGCVGFMVILGAAEREKFEAQRSDYSEAVQKVYDESTTYHDGKWIMFTPEDESLFDDFMRLLAIKRRPNAAK